MHRAVRALQEVQAGLVARAARLNEQQNRALHIATVHQDAAIIESPKRSALPHDEGGRRYQPMVAVWAEADLVLADEFRDGNVAARQEPLNCARLAFAVLPSTVRERYFFGDSACHGNELLGWLRHLDREKESAGRIGFAISTVMSRGLDPALAAVKDSELKTFATEADGTRHQRAEVVFLPTDSAEKKDSRPLCYVGLRLLKPQGVLFADGIDSHPHAVVTHLPWARDRLLRWHREKAGTVDHGHDEVKNALAGGHMPSQHFAANAAWFKRALMAYNLASAIKGAVLLGGGTHDALQALPAGRGEPGRPDEPLCQHAAVAVVRQRGGHRPDPVHLGRLPSADPGLGGKVARARTASREPPLSKSQGGFGVAPWPFQKGDRMPVSSEEAPRTLPNQPKPRPVGQLGAFKPPPWHLGPPSPCRLPAFAILTRGLESPPAEAMGGQRCWFQIHDVFPRSAPRAPSVTLAPRPVAKTASPLARGIRASHPASSRPLPPAATTTCPAFAGSLTSVRISTDLKRP